MAEFDATFLRAVRGGDAAAFTALVKVYVPRVRRMAVHYFKSPFDQEEAVQEAFLLLYRQREAVDPLRADALGGFVLTLARRRMLDLLRAAGRQPPGDELDEGQWEADEPGPFEAAADAELAALVGRFEARLKPAWRPYFRAVFVEGRDFDEAREALGLGRLRARYLKAVLLRALRRHRPLKEYFGKAVRT